jgi:transposase
MKPYSKDLRLLRLKVLEALDRGMPRRELAKIFGISMPTIKRWLKRRRETGEVEPRPSPGLPARKGMALEEALPAQLRANPDFTLEESTNSYLRRLTACRSLRPEHQPSV